MFRRATFVSLAGVVFISGCSKEPPASDPPEAKQATIVSEFGPETTQTHHFGDVPAIPGQRISHEYTIRNMSGKKVHLARAVNGKPCCGIVAFEPVTLSPGESARLSVTLKFSDSFDPVSHFAMVETDHPLVPALEFRTYANPRPRISFVPENDSISRLIPGQSLERSFVAKALGTAERPAIDLDAVRIESEIPISWTAPATMTWTDSGIEERTRRATVTLPASEMPGDRIASVRLVHGAETFDMPNLRWNVSRVVAATPGSLIFPRGQESTERTVALKSQDGKPFEILGCDSNLAGLSSNPLERIAADSQQIRVVFDPSRSDSKSRVGVLKIRISHPHQRECDIGVLVTTTEARPEVDRNDGPAATRGEEESK